MKSIRSENDSERRWNTDIGIETLLYVGNERETVSLCQREQCLHWGTSGFIAFPAPEGFMGGSISPGMNILASEKPHSVVS